MQCSLKIVLFLLSSLWVFAGCDALKELEEQTGSVELEPVDPVRETVLAAPSRNYVHEMLVTSSRRGMARSATDTHVVGNA